jgi:hypothetical protein
VNKNSRLEVSRYFLKTLVCMGWLSKLFGKKEKMSLKEKTLDELKELLSTKDFQWLKGDQLGSVEIYQDVVEDTSTGMIFVCFSGGGRMNIELLQEYMEMFPTQRVNFEPAPQVQPAFPEAPSIITTTQNQTANPNVAVRVGKLTDESGGFYGKITDIVIVKDEYFNEFHRSYRYNNYKKYGSYAI